MKVTPSWLLIIPGSNSFCQEMVCKMVASKLLGVVSIFMIVNYAAGNGQCVASIRGTSRCPPAWSQWQDKCYKMHDADVTWEEGKEICVELGGVMVVPQSNEEFHHIINMCSCPWLGFWIGCNDIQTEGLYTFLVMMFNIVLIISFNL